MDADGPVPHLLNLNRALASASKPLRAVPCSGNPGTRSRSLKSMPYDRRRAELSARADLKLPPLANPPVFPRIPLVPTQGHFRAIRGAVTLKHLVRVRSTRPRHKFPRHSWRGHIEARSCGCENGRRIVDFRAIRGAVTLKRCLKLIQQLHVSHFRAIRGAVTLKHLSRKIDRAKESRFPRHSWRGHIEAAIRAAGVRRGKLFPRHSWRGHIEARFRRFG